MKSRLFRKYNQAAIDARFWKHVQVAANEECWPWLASKDGAGYGRFNERGLLVGAHRKSYEMAHGKIPDGLHVCHHCDNKICVNPNHLFAGSRGENMLDMYRKGRHPYLKTDDAQYKEIMRRLQDGEPQQRIASDFGISQVQVSRFKLGKILRFKSGSAPL